MDVSAKYVAGAVAASAGALALWWLNSEPAGEKFAVIADEVQSREVGLATRTTARSGESLLERFYGDVSTAYEALLRGAKVSGDGACLGCRSGPGKGYDTWLTYNQVINQAELIGSGLINVGLPAANSSLIGIFAANCPEFTLLQLACFTYSMVSVPLYETLGTQALIHIANQAKLEVIMCDDPKRVLLLLEMSAQMKTVTTVILVKAPDALLRQKVEAAGWKLVTFSELQKSGESNRRPIKPPQVDDLLLVCYTSGTTGNPKGAMLTHRNMIASISATVKTLADRGMRLSDSGEVHLSYLPMAHGYEQVVQLLVLMIGGRIGYSQGDVRLLTDDLATLRPTLFPSVPRLLNRIYDKVKQAVGGSKFRKFLLDRAIASKQHYLSRGLVTQNTLWDRIVFKKIQQSLGGRVRVIVTGSAPIADEVLGFLRCALGVVVLEGYGQTECAAVATFTLPGTLDGGNVGTPVPCNLVRLVDVPEMDYSAKDGKGEVCLKGPNVFKGYLHDPEKTAEALDADGWLHTGDIGLWLPNGTLKIIDRRKNIFKLAQGEYIAPEKIESVYVRSPLVAQVYVHGESLKASVVAIVVPDPETLPSWAVNNLQAIGSNGPLAAPPFSELCKHPKVKEAIKRSMDEVAKEAGLKSLEQAKAIYVHDEMFSIANGLLTPTLKLKRIDARKRFAKEIEMMYTTVE